MKNKIKMIYTITLAIILLISIISSVIFLVITFIVDISIASIYIKWLLVSLATFAIALYLSKKL